MIVPRLMPHNRLEHSKSSNKKALCDNCHKYKRIKHIIYFKGRYLCFHYRYLCFHCRQKTPSNRVMMSSSLIGRETISLEEALNKIYTVKTYKYGVSILSMINVPSILIDKQVKLILISPLPPNPSNELLEKLNKTCTVKTHFNSDNSVQNTLYIPKIINDSIKNLKVKLELVPSTPSINNTQKKLSNTNCKEVENMKIKINENESYEFNSSAEMTGEELLNIAEKVKALMTSKLNNMEVIPKLIKDNPNKKPHKGRGVNIKYSKEEAIEMIKVYYLGDEEARKAYCKQKGIKKSTTLKTTAYYLRKQKSITPQEVGLKKFPDKHSFWSFKKYPQEWKI